MFFNIFAGKEKMAFYAKIESIICNIDWKKTPFFPLEICENSPKYLS
jgi:hypothetical protein